MKRMLALVLGFALAIALAACGGKDPGSAGSSSTPAAGAPAASAPAPDASVPADAPDSSAAQNAPAPDAPAPDVSTPAVSVPEAGPSPALNKEDFTLKTAGASYRLKLSIQPSEESSVVWTSSDESVAAVDQNGNVTAVAPGTATITASVGDLSAQCIVRCRWEEAPQTPEAPEASEEPQPSAPSAEELAALYADAITNSGSEMAQYNPPFSSLSPDASFVLEMLGLTSEDTGCFAVSLSMMNVHAYNISVIRPEAGREQAVVDALNGYIAQKQTEFEHYLADQYEITRNAKVSVLSDGTVVMVMCEDQDAVLASIRSAIEAN